jgi:hypothetical protein
MIAGTDRRKQSRVNARDWRGLASICVIVVRISRGFDQNNRVSDSGNETERLMMLSSDNRGNKGPVSSFVLLSR